MNRDELLALALRVEALTGPDRGMDVWIDAVAGKIIVPNITEADVAFMVEEYDYRDHEDCLQTCSHADAQGVPRYTASLDAAMTLVPEGWSRSVLQLPDGTGEAGVLEFALPDKNGKRWRERTMADSGRVKAATPELALAAAALRALAAQGGE